MKNVAGRFGIPEKEASCSGCGKIYGHHGTAVCIACEECTSCCGSRLRREHKLITPDEFLTKRYLKPKRNL